MNSVTHSPIQNMGSIQLCQYLQSDKSLTQAFFDRSIFLLTHLEHARSFDARGLATWIYAIAKKGDHGKDIMREDHRLVPAWAEAAISKIHFFEAQGLANIIYAFSILGIQPPEDFLKAWMDNSMRIMHIFNAQDLAHSLYAFGVLGIQPPNDFRKAWIDKSMRTIHTFNAQNLANSLYAFGVLEIQPPNDFLRVWMGNSMPLMDTFNSQNLANSLYAFGVLGILPSKAFLRAWMDKSVRIMHTFTAQGLANSLYALGRLGIQPSEAFLKAWKAASLKEINDFNDQNLANSLYGYLLLYMVKGSTFVKLDQLEVDTLLHKMIGILTDNGVELLVATKRQFHTILTVLVAQNSPLINEKWAKRKLKQLEQELKPLSVLSTSELQKEIFKLASKVVTKGVDLTLEHWEAKIVTSIDIAYCSGTQKIAIQVDGPSHYYRDSALETSATKLNTLLLKEIAGYEVIRIKYSDWDHLKSVAEKSTYLKNLLGPLVAPVFHAAPQIKAKGQDVLQQEKLLEKEKEPCESTPLYTPLKNRAKKKKGKALKACKSTLSVEPVVESLSLSSAHTQNMLWKVALYPSGWRTLCTIL